MVTLSLGTKKKSYPSIKAAAKDQGISYMTLYMRLRFGLKPITAVSRKVRKYTKH